MKNLNKQKVQLKISQDMTIINAGEIKAKMEEALNSASSVDLTLKNVKVMDIAGLQLIYALKKEAEKKDQELNINFELEEKLLKTINIIGFGDLLEN